MSYEYVISMKIYKHTQKKKANLDSITQLNTYFKHYSQLKEHAIVYPLPSFINDLDNNHWHSMGEGLLEILNPKVAINPAILSYATLIDSYRNGNHKQFNATLSHYIQLLKNQYPAILFKSKLTKLF